MLKYNSELMRYAPQRFYDSFGFLQQEASEVSFWKRQIKTWFSISYWVKK